MAQDLSDDALFLTRKVGLRISYRISFHLSVVSLLSYLLLSFLSADKRTFSECFS